MGPIQATTFDEYNAQFPLGQPLPYEWIGRIVRFRAGENRSKAKPARKPKKTE